MQYALDLGDSVVIFKVVDNVPYPIHVDTDSDEGSATSQAIVEYIDGNRDDITLNILRPHATAKYAVYHPDDPLKPVVTNIPMNAAAIAESQG